MRNRPFRRGGLLLSFSSAIHCSRCSTTTTTIPAYLTTSLLPSGNRLVPEGFCCGSSNVENVTSNPTSDLYSSDIGLQWIIGIPEEDYVGTPEARPLVLQEEAPDSTNDYTSSYVALKQPSTTATDSAAIPTPNGGLLFLEELAGRYHLTQLSPNGTDVTHKSLRTTVQDPLPDSFISFSADLTLWSLFTGATDVYDHAVLGDPWEGTALTVLKWNGEDELVEFHSQATLDDEPQRNTVFEGKGPIWADVNGDGQDDIVTTISNSAVGARLRVYALATEQDNLEMLAQAEAINRGGRWLHQLAIGPLGPNGETEIVEVRTPHVGGIVRYYQYDASAPVTDNLMLQASTSPYTSHSIRSLNLGQSLMGDFNGDGIPELAIQNQQKNRLVGLQRSDSGVSEVWSIPLSSRMESNMAVSCHDGVLELLFSTASHDIVHVNFGPASDTEVGWVVLEEDEQLQPVERSSGSTTPTSGCWRRLIGSSIGGLGVYELLLQMVLGV